MATIKSFTSVEQSKKLSEILPLESADMYYPMLYAKGIDGGGKNISDFPSTIKSIGVEDIPCWSLARLLDVLPSGKALIHDKESGEYKCISKDFDTAFYSNPIDACYELILKLHERKML